MCGQCCESCGCDAETIDDRYRPQGDMVSQHPKPSNPSTVTEDDKIQDPPDANELLGPYDPIPHRRIRRLWCQTGFDLCVYPNGTVRGTKSPRNKYALLEFEAVGLSGHIRIKGIATGFYVTMTIKGRIQSQPSPNSGTVWIETGFGSGTTYHSLLSLDYAHKGYYLAIKKNGKPKDGQMTFVPSKSTSFLSRIIAEE